MLHDLEKLLFYELNHKKFEASIIFYEWNFRRHREMEEIVSAINIYLLPKARFSSTRACFQFQREMQRKKLNIAPTLSMSYWQWNLGRPIANHSNEINWKSKTVFLSIGDKSTTVLFCMEFHWISQIKLQTFHFISAKCWNTQIYFYLTCFFDMKSEKQTINSWNSHKFVSTHAWIYNFFPSSTRDTFG